MKRSIIAWVGLAAVWFVYPYIAFWIALGLLIGSWFIPQPEWAEGILNSLKDKIESVTGISL